MKRLAGFLRRLADRIDDRTVFDASDVALPTVSPNGLYGIDITDGDGDPIASPGEGARIHWTADGRAHFEVGE